MSDPRRISTRGQDLRLAIPSLVTQTNTSPMSGRTTHQHEAEEAALGAILEAVYHGSPLG